MDTSDCHRAKGSETLVSRWEVAQLIAGEVRIPAGAGSGTQILQPQRDFVFFLHLLFCPFFPESGWATLPRKARVDTARTFPCLHRVVAGRLLSLSRP